MREMKRTKTNFTLFDRIRQAKNPTIRGSFVDKEKSIQENDWKYIWLLFYNFDWFMNCS